MALPLDILYPWVLLALLAWLPLWWWTRRSLAPLSPARRWLALGVRALVLALLVLALADVRWQREERREALVYLVDASISMGTAAEAAWQTWREALGESSPFATTLTVPFAARAGMLASTEATIPALQREQLGPAATDLQGALQFAEAAAPPGHAVTILALTDGRATGDWRAQGEALAEAGVRVHTVPVEPPDRAEILVRDVEAPTRAKEGEPFAVTARIVSNREQPARVQVFRNGVLAAEQTARLAVGENTLSFTEEVAADRLTEFAVVVTGEADTLVENNRLSTLVRGEGRARALLLAGRPDAARFLSLGLRQEDILLDVRPAVGAPRDLDDLQNYDLLIVDNVPATDLSPTQLELYAQYVRDFGGGFLMLGGEQAYGLGGYYRTPVEELLPVRTDFERDREEPSLGLALLIDKSGSMNGEKIEMAKAAAKAAIELLAPNDYAGVVVFDNQAFWAADLQPVLDRFGLLDLVSTIQAGGGTNLAPAMEQAYARLSVSQAKLRHVIILTDGHSQPGPFEELATRMVQDEITVSTVGLGSGADVGLLEALARLGNGRFYFTEDARRVPQIFAKETMTVAKSALQEIPFLPQVLREPPFLANLDLAGAPFLYGYVQTEAKPGSDLWLVTEQGDPLLATWRVGLGMVGAFTSDARNQWAVEWLRWQGYAPFWAQVTRFLMRSGELASFPVAVVREGDRLRLSVDTVDGTGQLRTGLEVSAVVVDPENDTRTLPLPETLPGRHEMTLPARVQGNYHFDVRVQEPGAPSPLRRQLSASVGYPEEYQLGAVDRTALRTLSEATGGLFDPDVAALQAAEPRTTPREVMLWPWFALAAALVFVGDVAARRWPGRETAGPRG